MADLIDFTSKTKRDDGDFGELIATVYVYEKGHYVHVPDGIESTISYRRNLRDQLFNLTWHEAFAVSKLTDEADDQPIVMSLSYGGGRVVTWAVDDHLTLEQRQWVVRRLRDLEQCVPAVTDPRPDNDNHQETAP